MDYNRLTALALTAGLFAFALVSSWIVVALFEGAPVWRSRRRVSPDEPLSNTPSSVGRSTYLRRAQYLRVAFWLAYATALGSLAASFDDAPASMPLLLIALGLPLAFRLVPRNWLFGMRSPRTLLTTEEVWYRQNVITGVAFAVVGTIWLAILAARGVILHR